MISEARLKEIRDHLALTDFCACDLADHYRDLLATYDEQQQTVPKLQERIAALEEILGSILECDLCDNCATEAHRLLDEGALARATANTGEEK